MGVRELIATLAGLMTPLRRTPEQDRGAEGGGPIPG